MNKQVVIFSRGFGAGKDDCVMFTNIAAATSETPRAGNSFVRYKRS